MQHDNAFTELIYNKGTLEHSSRFFLFSFFNFFILNPLEDLEEWFFECHHFHLIIGSLDQQEMFLCLSLTLSALAVGTAQVC